MSKKKDKTYHFVLTIEDETTLQFSLASSRLPRSTGATLNTRTGHFKPPAM
jgi:hypothetical protein